MDNQKLQHYFLLIFLTVALILAFFVLRLFLISLIMAAVFAVVFQPLHQKILDRTHNRQGVAALSTIIIIIAVILVPLIFLGIQILEETRQLYSSLITNGGNNTIFNISKGLIDDFQRFFPALREFSIDINQYFKQGLGWLLQHLGPIFTGFAKMMVSVFIFLIALYYMLKDGKKLKKTIIALSPLSDVDDEAISKKLEMAINSVIKGNLVVALIQGILTTVGFLIFGVPNAVLWGSVAAIAALIPGIGTALVLIPAIAFLFLTSGFFYGLGLLIWGMVAVGLIDNFLGHKLVSRGAQLHPLIILLSVLGGIGFFGPIGFLLGPLTLSLFFALLDIYSSMVKTK